MSAHPRRRPSRARRAGLQLLVALAVLATLELGLRLAGYGAVPEEEDPYVGFSHALPLFTDDGTGRLTTAPYKRNHFNVQSFYPQKAADETRIISLGGSTTYGRPYTDTTSFSGWLRAWLPTAAPDRRWEVINAGGISYASYRVSVVLEEVLRYEPDAVIIYSGHNEFLEERSYSGLSSMSPWVLRLGTWARSSALFSTLRSLTGSSEAGDALNETEGTPQRIESEVRTRLDASIGPDAYTRDDVLREQILEHYRFNLVRMVRMAQQAGVVVVLVAPASELLNCMPFKSEHGQDVEAQDAQWIDELLEEGAGTATRLALLSKAAKTDPRHALTWYRLGEALLEAGQTAEARAAFERARDEDIVPLRALTEVRDLVRTVARQEGAFFVDAVALMDEASLEIAARPIPGSELFLDHVHMTIGGYRRLAEALFSTLVEAGVVQPSPSWNEEQRQAIDEHVESTLLSEDHVRALSRLASVLDWAGKAEEAQALNQRALQLAGGRDAMSYWQEGNFHLEQGEIQSAITAFEYALEIDSGYAEAHFNLSLALRRSKRLEEALAHAQEAARLAPSDSATLYGLGAILAERGRTEEARLAWLSAIEADPAHAGAYNALGIAALQAQDKMLAEAYFRSAVAAQFDSAQSHYNLSLILASDGRADEAIHHLRQALQHDPQHEAAGKQLARLLDENG